MEIIRDPSYSLAHGARTDVIVVVLGEAAAIVRHRWRSEGTFRGQAFVDDQRCALICDHSTGRWHIRYEQCSAIEA